jgi:hypothetical protein
MQVSNLAVPVLWFLIEDMGIRRHARHEGSRALALVGMIVLDTYESSILACTKNVFKVYPVIVAKVHRFVSAITKSGDRNEQSLLLQDWHNLCLK